MAYRSGRAPPRVQPLLCDLRQLVVPEVRVGGFASVYKQKTPTLVRPLFLPSCLERSMRLMLKVGPSLSFHPNLKQRIYV